MLTFTTGGVIILKHQALRKRNARGKQNMREWWNWQTR